MPANVSFHDMLAKTFPEYDIDVVDIQAALAARRQLKIWMLFHALKDYGWEILLGRKRLKACELKTAYYQKLVKRIVSETVDKKSHAFSIQIQSLFDGSTPGLRHYIYTDHTHLANLQYESFDRRNLFSKDWIARETSIYDNASAVFTRSTNILRSLIDDYGCSPDRVECVYAGSNASLRELPTSTERYARQNVLFVGLDWIRKGGPVLLEAFREVSQSHPNARLMIVGASPEVDMPNCDVIGRVPLDRVHTYFEAASVFCMPTELEPFGIVFVEALSYGLPIVATDVGAVPDMVIDGVNGYLVAPRDAAALAGRLGDLLSDAYKCAAFGAKSRELAEARYNWDAVGDRIRARVLGDAKAAETKAQGRQ